MSVARGALCTHKHTHTHTHIHTQALKHVLVCAVKTTLQKVYWCSPYHAGILSAPPAACRSTRTITVTVSMARGNFLKLLVALVVVAWTAFLSLTNLKPASASDESSLAAYLAQTLSGQRSEGEDCRPGHAIV